MISFIGPHKVKPILFSRHFLTLPFFLIVFSGLSTPNYFFAPLLMHRDKAHTKLKDKSLFQCFHFCLILFFSPSINLLFCGFIKKQLFSLGKKPGFSLFLNHFQHLCLSSPLPFLPPGLCRLLSYLSVYLFIFHRGFVFFIRPFSYSKNNKGGFV